MIPKPTMDGMKKSDEAVVPMKAANKGAQTPAESPEGRASTKGNSRDQSTYRTQGRGSVSQAVKRIRQAATRKPQEKLTALLHHITTDALRCAFYGLKQTATAGVDGLVWKEYEDGLEERLLDLHGRVHSGAYRALPSRRVAIPKPDGGTRPLGIAALEDKIVQKAVVDVILTPIYEPEFIGFSYGFRPGRGAHDALDALAFGIERRKVNWLVDADIRAFFDRLSRDHLLRFLEHRIGDRRVLRLITKWLNAGVMENGEWKDDLQGTPQGAVVSPILANVYLHYVLDLWFQKKWRARKATGDTIIVRYADDFVVGCQRKADAGQFLRDLKERLGQFALDLHPDKTRLIEFGRFATAHRRARGERRPETFDFLGFTHYCRKTRNGGFGLGRKPIARVARVSDELRRNGVDVQPVHIEGRTIARSFWGRRWCHHLESCSDFENRLPRGRVYVRNGSVCHLDVHAGGVDAMVVGSDLYHVVVRIRKLGAGRLEGHPGRVRGPGGSISAGISYRFGPEYAHGPFVVPRAEPANDHRMSTGSSMSQYPSRFCSFPRFAESTPVFSVAPNTY